MAPRKKRHVVPAARRRHRTSNATRAQRPADAVPDRHPGDAERIAARRVQALELRKAGASYRQIAQATAVDVATAWDDVQAEMSALRALTGQAAEDARTLELARLDRWQSKLEANGLQDGDHRAVAAAVRISERRAKLLGLDAPVRVQPVAPERPLEASDDEELRRVVAQGAADALAEPA